MAEAGYKYKGEDIIYLVELEVDGTMTLLRPFDQVDGSHTFNVDELEVSTKDRSGTDYGDITESRSFEGELVYDDPFIPAMKRALRAKKFIKIHEVNLITKKSEEGIYMISNFDFAYPNGDFATYSLDANLFGNVTETTLTEIPEGAPELKIDEGNEGGTGGGEVEG